MASTVRSRCEQVELVPLVDREPLGKWHNRIRGWSQILFNSRPSYADTFPVDKMRRPLRDLIGTGEFDVVVFHHLFVVELVEEIGQVPAILAEDNVESDIKRKTLQQADHPIHKVRDWVSWRKLLRFEQKWVRRFPVCVAVSDRDAALLREMSPKTDVYVVPNGVDVASFTPPVNRRRLDTLLFFGTLSYGPNTDGLIWFCKHVLPAIREARPEVTLDVVGLDPPRRVLDLDQLLGVQVTGFVPDIRTKLWSATACVVPLHVGGGTRLKILEALAAGCPVVSTTIGAEGLSLVDGEHLIIADTPEAFARSTLALLDSAHLRRRLAVAGRQAVAEQYDWRPIAERLEAACMAAIDQHEAG